MAFFFPDFHSETVGMERTLCVIRPDTCRQFKVRETGTETEAKTATETETDTDTETETESETEILKEK